MKYICINEFYIETYDVYDMPTGDYRLIPANSIWFLDQTKNYIGGEAHLENEDLSWMEIPWEFLENNFREVREEDDD